MARMTLCNECGVIVSSGWGLRNHIRRFHTPGENQRVDEVLNDMNDDAQPNEADNEGMDNEDWDNEADNSSMDSEDWINKPAIAEYLAGLQAAGTLDLDAAMRFKDWGALPFDNRLIETLKFMRAVCAKGGSSTVHAQSILRYCRNASRRLALCLPKSLQTCWKRIAVAHKLLSAPIATVTVTTNIPQAIQALMCNPQETVDFTFNDPTEALVRLLLLSPLAARRENIALNYETSESFSDYCNGDRWKRVQEALPEGASALTCVIFFDGINMDAKGYASSEGAIIVGGNFRKKARESTYAKSALGTFPGIKFPKVTLVNRHQLHTKSRL